MNRPRVGPATGKFYALPACVALAVLAASCSSTPTPPTPESTFVDRMAEHGVSAAGNVELAHLVCTRAGLDLGFKRTGVFNSLVSLVRGDPEKPTYTRRESITFVRTAVEVLCPEHAAQANT